MIAAFSSPSKLEVDKLLAVARKEKTGERQNHIYRPSAHRRQLDEGVVTHIVILIGNMYAFKDDNGEQRQSNLVQTGNHKLNNRAGGLVDDTRIDNGCT